MTDDVLRETRGPVWIVTINRPEQRNAINAAVRDGLRRAFTDFEADTAARVLILTGAGDRAFCAGADLIEMSVTALGKPPKGFLPIIGQGIEVTKPTIAAVNGVAFAGGWLFAQMCDLCVASDTVRFAITEAKFGRGMPWGPPLIHLLPQRIALELLLTAAPITAARAYEVGYVNRVVPPAELMPTAIAMAEAIAANAPLTVAAAKEMIALSREMGGKAALAAAEHLFDHVFRSEDAQEGPRAFREKRPPVWRGR
ncbi:MAG: enoyl-CoA hydratase/isomerase family protein [Alphaproteobacteria bacterium]|nr:enoyl-CoA hydratase/isomerase family protein [Alphaproteobacteria bacterium]